MVTVYLRGTVWLSEHDVLRQERIEKRSFILEHLVKRAMKGDTDAFLELMTQNTQILYKTAWSVLRNNEDAADAVSETILTCFEKINTLRKPDAFRTWMLRILLNHCYNILRDQAHFDRSGEVPDFPGSMWEAEPDSFQELLQDVEEKYSTILTLYYADELTVCEIAELTGLNQNTVKTRLKRGREMVRRSLIHEE